MMSVTPCAHLIDTASSHGGPHCELGYSVPVHCGGCPAYAPGLTEQERTRCEVWSRVMGYHRPVSAYNTGKQQEHRDRVAFKDA